MKLTIISQRIWIGFVVAVFWLNVGAVTGQEALDEKPAKEAEATPAEETPVESPKEKPAETKPVKGIQEMTTEEKAAAGLEKLSPAELEYLDEWMRNNRRVAEKKAADKAAQKAKSEATMEGVERSKQMFLKNEALVSRVDGTMVPLTGRTTVRLEDGTKWKQANSEDRFGPRVKDHPAAAVFHTQFGYKMRIEGMPDFFVDPVRD